MKGLHGMHAEGATFLLIQYLNQIKDMMMNQEMASKLKKSLIAHEGYRNYPYVDTVGKLTIGIGYNISDRGLSDEWINTQYQQDVNYYHNKLSEFFWFKNLNENRQIALIDMCFMGWKKFLSFKRLIYALENYKYDFAAAEMLDSKWATQVGGRAEKLAEIMLTGEI